MPTVKARVKESTVNPRVYWLLWLLFLSLQFQTVDLLRVGIDEGAIVVKPYHLLAALYLLSLLSRRVISGLGWGMTIFLGIVLSVSILNVATYGLNPMVLNYAFAGALMLLTVNLGRGITEASWLRVLRSVSSVVYLAVIAKSLLYWEAIARFLAAPFGHPALPMFYAGGPNLEATWLSLSSVFFLRTRLFYPVLALAFVISALYASRIGLIIALASLLVELFQVRGRRRLALLLLGISLGLAAVAAAAPQLTDIYLLDRVMQIGTDPGSTGRLNLWAPVGEALFDRPLGYGAGNGIVAVRELSEVQLIEDNVHNYYFQVGLDFGLIGLVVLISLVLHLFLTEFRIGLSSPIGAYLLIFALAALLQFRGAEPILWFVMGIQLLLLRNRQRQTPVAPVRPTNHTLSAAHHKLIDL